MTAAEAGRRMSSRELSEWMARDQIIAEDRRTAELERKAQAGVQQRLTRGPRRR